jgi:hypothetical protein
MYISHKRLITYVDNDGTDTKRRPREILRLVRGEVGEEEFQRKVGGSGRVSPEAILLTYLCELEKTSETLDNVSSQSPEAQKEILRGMQASDEFTGTPHRPKSRKQRAGKHSDSLQALSRLLAHDSQKAWSYYRWQNANTILRSWAPGWESGIARVVDGFSGRVDRLRCLGNAVVPLQIYPILETIARIERGEIR